MHAKLSERDWAVLAREVLDVEIEGLVAVRDAIGDSFTLALGYIACCQGRVVVTGIGKSGLVGRKIAATLSSTGTPSFFLHPVEGAHGDMGMIKEGDVALAISNSGETDELNAILPTLRSLGAKIVAMTGRPGSTLGRLADVVLDTAVPREACPMDLAPTASTTAALALGDALAVCLIHLKQFKEQDFARFHPGGALGQRLKTRVRDIMHTDKIPCVAETASFGEALAVLNNGGLGTVIVTTPAGGVAGILTDGDLRRIWFRGGDKPAVDPGEPVANHMIRAPRTGTPDQSVAELLDVMERLAITALPIVDSADTLVGIVHLHDLLGKGRLTFSA
ncbi:MAG: SIS domain-containing protein [Desulfovibrionaceae bacterium]